MSRQLVSHGHFIYNERKVTVPSIQVKAGDKVVVRDGSQSSVLFSEIAGKNKDFKAPGWMSVDLKNMATSIVSMPEASTYEFDLKRIIEYYTR